MTKKYEIKDLTSQSNLPFTISVFVLEKGFFPVHTHDFSELVIILEGTGIHIVNGKKFNLSSGDIFVLKNDDQHSFENTKNLKICNIVYHENIMIYPKDDLNNIPGYLLLFQFNKKQKYADYNSTIHIDSEALLEVENIIYKLVYEYDNNGLGRISILKTYFKLLIILISSCYQQNKNNSNQSHFRLAKAISFIEDNFTKPLSLKEMSSKANMSTSNFSKVFKEKMLCSPLNYMISCRLKKSCDLLSKTDFSITEISGFVGFEDSNYFSRQFKKHFGISPLQFKRIHLTSK